MGRTLATYRNLLEEEIERWRDYRRTLRRLEKRQSRMFRTAMELGFGVIVVRVTLMEDYKGLFPGREEAGEPEEVVLI